MRLAPHFQTSLSKSQRSSSYSYFFHHILSLSRSLSTSRSHKHTHTLRISILRLSFTSLECLRILNKNLPKNYAPPPFKASLALSPPSNPPYRQYAIHGSLFFFLRSRHHRFVIRRVFRCETIPFVFGDGLATSQPNRRGAAFASIPRHFFLLFLLLRHRIASAS